MHDLGCRADTVNRAGAFFLNQDRFRWHPVPGQVIVGHAALGERRIAARAARSQDPRGHMLQVEKERMIQPRLKHRRRTAVVLGRAQHDDDVGRPRLIDIGLLANLGRHADYGENGPAGEYSNNGDEESHPFHALCWAFRFIVPVSRHTLVSEQNPLLRRVRRAAGRGELTDDGYALAEGPHLVDEAARAGVDIGAVILAESARFTPLAGVRTLHIADAVFARLSSTESPQGVLALVRLPERTWAEVSVNRSLIVVLDRIQDPGNAGAILRAAEGFGATGAVFLKGSVGPHNPKCMRGSAGSVFRLPIAAGVEPRALLDAGLPLFAADPRAAGTLADADLRGPCGLVIGAESRGLSASIAAAATGLRIPTTGVESLNAAVAAGILLYEARRQRGFA